jgi:hypothetical protein
MERRLTEETADSQVRKKLASGAERREEEGRGTLWW